MNASLCYFVALDRILKINSSLIVSAVILRKMQKRQKKKKKKKKIVFTFFVGAPGTFDEKYKTIFTKNVKHFYIFRRGSHLYGQRTCDNLWKLGKPVNTLYPIVHLHISHQHK